MTRLFCILLTLLYSLSGPVMGGYSDFSRWSNAANNAPTLAQRIIAAERTGSGLKADASHRAAGFLSEAQLNAGTSFTIRGGDDVARELLQTPGGMNGKSGIFEYILDPTKGVTHQRFIPGGGITGTPNQVVPR
jgi:hypothetical protein